MNESDNDHSMKHCDQILSGKVGIGKSAGRRHHLHLQQSGGIQESGTNHNKKNCNMSSGGRRGKYSFSAPSALFFQESCTFVVCFCFFTFRDLMALPVILKTHTDA